MLNQAQATRNRSRTHLLACAALALVVLLLTTGCDLGDDGTGGMLGGDDPVGNLTGEGRLDREDRRPGGAGSGAGSHQRPDAVTPEAE